MIIEYVIKRIKRWIEYQRDVAAVPPAPKSAWLKMLEEHPELHEVAAHSPTEVGEGLNAGDLAMFRSLDDTVTLVLKMRTSDAHNFIEDFHECMSGDLGSRRRLDDFLELLHYGLEDTIPPRSDPNDD